MVINVVPKADTKKLLEVRQFDFQSREVQSTTAQGDTCAGGVILV